MIHAEARGPNEPQLVGWRLLGPDALDDDPLLHP